MELSWVRCRLCERDLDCYTFKGWMTVTPCKCCRVKYRLLKWLWKKIYKPLKVY